MIKSERFDRFWKTFFSLKEEESSFNIIHRKTGWFQSFAEIKVLEKQIFRRLSSRRTCIWAKNRDSSSFEKRNWSLILVLCWKKKKFQKNCSTHWGFKMVQCFSATPCCFSNVFCMWHVENQNQKRQNYNLLIAQSGWIIVVEICLRIVLSPE